MHRDLDAAAGHTEELGATEFDQRLHFKILQDRNSYYNQMKRARELHDLYFLLGRKNEVTFRAALSRGGRVLDIGCGLAFAAAGIAEEYPTVEYHGVDISCSFLLERSNPGRPASDGVERLLAAGDAALLPYADNSFRTVFSIWCLPYVPDKLEAIREAYRVLEPGGEGFLFLHRTYLSPETIIDYSRLEHRRSIIRVRKGEPLNLSNWAYEGSEPVSDLMLRSKYLWRDPKDLREVRHNS